MGNVYAEAREALTCLALPMEQNREALLGNNRFLRLLCESLTGKMQLVTAMDAAPAGLRAARPDLHALQVHRRGIKGPAAGRLSFKLAASASCSGF